MLFLSILYETLISFVCTGALFVVPILIVEWIRFNKKEKADAQKDDDPHD